MGAVLVSMSIAARAVFFHAPVATRRASFCIDWRIVRVFLAVPFCPCSGLLINHVELAYAIFGRIVALYSCTPCCRLMPHVYPEDQRYRRGIGLAIAGILVGSLCLPE